MDSRSQALAAAVSKEFDLIVVGGGIVGAGIAQDAASRGLSVLLIEKEDFASGTSSKTTKLIHGGLRYLEQFHFHLTRELCQERGLLEHLAPHMVKDFSFVLPITKQNSFFGVKAQLGLTLYDILAWSVKSAHNHEKINQKETLESAPALSADIVAGGLKFHDCITDDSRLVLEVLKSAYSLGAQLLNYVEVTGFDLVEGHTRGVKCHDRYSGQEFTVRCKACVNAAGVWSDQLLQRIDSNWKPTVAPAKGTHIMVPLSAFETNTALFLPTEDGRYVFVVPWQRALMIGTTDTNYKGDIDNPLPLPSEVDYLLDVVNKYSNRKLTRTDVIAGWAGLRPLVGGSDSVDSEKTANLSREHLIFEGPGKIVGLIGGKLTSYRLMAGQVIEKVLELNPSIAAPKQSQTRRLMLGGWTDKNDYLTTTATIAAKARKLSIEPGSVEHLVSSYGKDAEAIVEIVEKQPALLQRICPDYPNIMAEIPFCVINEMAVSLEDLVYRRMRLALVNQTQCKQAGPKILELMQSLLKWDDARAQLELASLEKSLNEHLSSFATVPS